MHKITQQERESFRILSIFRTPVYAGLFILRPSINIITTFSLSQLQFLGRQIVASASL